MCSLRSSKHLSLVGVSLMATRPPGSTHGPPHGRPTVSLPSARGFMAADAEDAVGNCIKKAPLAAAQERDSYLYNSPLGGTVVLHLSHLGWCNGVEGSFRETWRPAIAYGSHDPGAVTPLLHPTVAAHLIVVPFPDVSTGLERFDNGSDPSYCEVFSGWFYPTVSALSFKPTLRTAR